MQNALETSYDVVIVGGAIYGSALAWWLTNTPGFDGEVLVVERDPTYEFASTSHTNSCIRQQFSAPVNIQISQFGAEFIKNFRHFMHDDPEVPELALQFSEGSLHVWRVSADRAEKVAVRLVRRRGGLVIVDAPLGEDDAIVVEGTQRLRPDSPVQVLNPPTGASS